MKEFKGFLIGKRTKEEKQETVVKTIGQLGEEGEFIFTEEKGLEELKEALNYQGSGLRYNDLVDFLKQKDVVFPVKTVLNVIHVSNFKLELVDDSQKKFTLNCSSGDISISYQKDNFEITEKYEKDYVLISRQIKEVEEYKVKSPKYGVHTSFLEEGVTIVVLKKDEILLKIVIHHEGIREIIRKISIVNLEFENFIFGAIGISYENVYKKLLEMYDLSEQKEIIPKIRITNPELELEYRFGEVVKHIVKITEIENVLSIDMISKTWVYTNSKLYTINFLKNEESENLYELSMLDAEVNTSRFKLYQNYFKYVAKSNWREMTNFIEKEKRDAKYHRGIPKYSFKFKVTKEELKDFNIYKIVNEIELKVAKYLEKN